MQANAAKRVRAFNPSHYERAFDVRLVLSGTVHIMDEQNIIQSIQQATKQQL